MTLSEFKAWFEGFTEDMPGPPSQKKWKKIQARVAEITGDPVTQNIFYDRYWRYGSPIYPYWPYNGYSSGGIGLSASSLGQQTYAANSAADAGIGVGSETWRKAYPERSWDGTAAMQALGKADALALEGNGG